MRYIEDTEQIHRGHHAYREGLSTTTSIVEIVDQIIRATDRNEITASMTIDQTAAFYCIDHAILLRKLEYYSISISTRNWIESYLDKRTNYVVIGSFVFLIRETPGLDN